jgi:hypothetical protein
MAVVLIAAIISIRDYFTHKEKQKLYARSLIYEEELLGEKYIILKSRNINDEIRETLLKEIEDFLKKSEKITNKFSDVLKRYNSTANGYNKYSYILDPASRLFGG